MKGVYYMDDKLVNWIAELQSIAQAGLTYGKDVYDRERYQRIREITAEMMAAKTGLSLEKVTDLFCGETGYQTPKVDTRARVGISFLAKYSKPVVSIFFTNSPP